MLKILHIDKDVGTHSYLAIKKDDQQLYDEEMDDKNFMKEGERVGGGAEPRNYLTYLHKASFDPKC